MQFLHLNETAEWCREHDVAVDERWHVESDARLGHTSRLLYAPNGPTDRADQIAAACLAALGDWEECLLWPVAWDIWESDEDWPAFYGARGARGEPYSLGAKPGHLFHASEVEDLRLFLTMVLQYAWDAHVLPARSGGNDRRLWCSHDGWVELHATHPVALAEVAV
jgi:hypothetical protein